MINPINTASRHQPVEEKPTNDVKASYYQCAKNPLAPVALQKTQVQCLANPTGSNPIVQVDILVENHRVVIPGLARPEPDPARATNEGANNDEQNPHQEAPTKHTNRKPALPDRVITVTQRT